LLRELRRLLDTLEVERMPQHGPIRLRLMIRE
jgi:hypothetical protein